MDLVGIKKATDGKHKLQATFKNRETGRTKTTKFGAAGMDDYTKTKDKEQRARYLQRHRANENWSNPTTAGSLSKHILWGDKTSVQANIKDFKKKFNL